MDALYVNYLHAKKIPSQFGLKRFYLQTKLPPSNKTRTVWYTVTLMSSIKATSTTSTCFGPQDLLFFSISMYTPRDFWMESFVMKLTKFVVSASRFARSLSIVDFLIIDLLIWRAWSVGGGNTVVKTKCTITGKDIIFWTKIIQFTWDGQPFRHSLSSCAKNFILRNKLIHQTDLQGFRGTVQ